MAACNGEGLLQSNNDATQLQNCTTYNGSLSISEVAKSITLNGVNVITGDFGNQIAASPQLMSLDADNLTEIQGRLHLTELEHLAEISFPVLDKVDSINFTSVKALQVQNMGSISMPSLTSITNGISVYETFMSSNFTASKLTTIGDGMTFRNIPNMQFVSFPNLNTINGGLSVTNNTQMRSMQFESLSTVNGDLNISGTFDYADFSSLQSVTGMVNISISSNNASVCVLFEELMHSKVIEGILECYTSSTPAEHSSPKHGHKLSAGAIVGIVLGSVAAVIIIAGVLYFFYRRRKQRSPVEMPIVSENGPHTEQHQMPLGGHHETAELHASNHHPHISELNAVSRSSTTTSSAMKPPIATIPQPSTTPTHEQLVSPLNNGVLAELKGEPSILSGDRDHAGSDQSMTDFSHDEITPISNYSDNGPAKSVRDDSTTTTTTGAPASERSLTRKSSMKRPVGQNRTGYSYNDAVM